MTEIILSDTKKIRYENLNWNVFELKETNVDGVPQMVWTRRNNFNYSTLRGILQGLIREEVIENIYIDKIENIEKLISEKVIELANTWSKYVSEEDKNRI